MKSRGLFIVLEGLDRSGKSTQCQKLVDFLAELGLARLQRFPDRSEPTTGPKIDNFLKTAKCPYERAEEIHCLFAENRKVIDPLLREVLLNGEIVVADRYSFSGIAYTAAKNIPLDFACETEIGLLKPDIVIFLKADPNETAKRSGFGEEALEKLDFQETVAKKMKSLVNPEFWVEVDALKSIDEVHDDIKSIVTTLMQEPVKPLESFKHSDFNL